MFKSAWRWSKKLSSILGFQAKGLWTCPTYHRFRVVCKSEFLETPQSSANQNSWSPYLFPAQAFLPNKQEAVHNICLPAVCCLQSDSPVPYPSALATSNHHPFSVGPSAPPDSSTLETSQSHKCPTQKRKDHHPGCRRYADLTQIKSSASNWTLGRQKRSGEKCIDKFNLSNLPIYFMQSFPGAY